MTAMPTLRNIANDTPANAVDVDFNFDTIQTHVANEMINRDGSVGMTGQLLLAGNPAGALGAVPKQYVDAVLPAGMIAPYAGSAAPSGWLLADGSVVSQATYTGLFAVIGSTYNTGGEGAGNFRLPNFKGRVPIGRDSGTAPFTTLGAAGGSKDASLVSHSHTVNSHTHSIDHDHGSTSTATDGSHSHPSIQTADLGGFYLGRGAADYASGVGFSPPTDSGSPVIVGSGNEFIATTGGAHAHSVDLPNFTGSSGAATPGTNSQGVSATDANLIPYQIINYIIKV